MKRRRPELPVNSARIRWARSSLAIAFALACVLAVSGCGGGASDVVVDDDAGDSDAPGNRGGDGYAVAVDIRGVEGTGGELTLVASHPMLGVLQYDVPLTGDETFNLAERPCPACGGDWPDGGFPSDTAIRAIVESPQSPTQRCAVSPQAASLISDANIGVTVDCTSYAIEYEVIGLEGSGAEFTLVISDTEFGVEEYRYPLDANGTFSTADAPCPSCGGLWPTGRFPGGGPTAYRFIARDFAQEPAQRCRLNGADPSSGTLVGPIESEDVTGVVIDCTNHPIEYTVQGLEGSGAELTLVVSDPDLGVEQRTLSLDDNGTFRTDDRPCAGCALWPAGRFPGGDKAVYRVFVSPHPDAPTQRCELSDAAPKIIDAQSRFEVTCRTGEASVAGEVAGLLGSGLILSLSREVEINGNRQFLVVERLDVDADGPFEFDTLLDADDPYIVDVWRSAEDPMQECLVENGTGTIASDSAGLGVDVTDVEVNCAEPLRRWEFDNSDSIGTDFPLDGGEQRGGIVEDDYFFGQGFAVPLGAVSGLDTTELFQLYLDGPGTSGVVYSNRTGETYWLAVEAPRGAYIPRAEGIYDHFVGLDTYWRFRKAAQSANFELELSSVNLLAYDDLPVHPDGSTGELRAGAELRIRAYRVDGDEVDTEPFFDTHGRMVLQGAMDTGNNTTRWRLIPITATSATTELWSVADFDLDPSAGVGNDPEQVAFATLPVPIPVEIDVSGLAVDEEFLVISEAVVQATNSYTPEGGAAAYLRDPAEFDPGEPRGGVTVTDASGLMLVDIGDILLGNLPSGGPVPEACDPAVTDLAVLAFDADAYRVSENAAELPTVTVTRNGSDVGLVTARISLTDGSAVAGEDFTSSAFTVRFGDGSTAPRTLELPVIDDALTESDETLTVTLDAPEGCAEIGPRASANVTIEDDDPARGTVSLDADSYRVDEADGFATVTLQRTGGDYGSLDVTVETADGTAIAGVDYAAVSERIVFGDGDADPREIQIPLLDNVLPQADRTVLLSLTSADPDALGAPASALLTIADDDMASGTQGGTLQFGAATYRAGEGDGVVTVEVARSGGTDGAVTVELATVDDTATAGDDYGAMQTVVQFADGDDTPQTVEIAIVDDLDAENDHHFRAILSAPGGGAVLGSIVSIPVVIFDNDGPPPPLPAAPVPSANAGLKQLLFDWVGVAGVSYYRLLVNPDGASGFAPALGDLALDQTAAALPVAGHLFDWADAAFLLQACNSAGCTDSSEIGVDTLALAAIGFFKASNTDGRQQRTPDFGDEFGSALALSGDGRTLAVSAPEEDSAASFVNGDQSDNSVRQAGAVYVFGEGASGWVQEAYLKASNPDRSDGFGESLALSEDGSTLAIGASAEASAATGVDGDASDNGAFDAGAVYVYVRSGAVWSLQAYVKASNTEAQDAFGRAVALSADGNTLVVGAPGEAADSDGVNGEQSDNAAPGAGAVYVFTRSGDAWQQADYLKATNSETEDRFGSALALSADGVTLAVGAPGEDSAATGVDGDQSDNSAPGTGGSSSGAGAVYLFDASNGSWVQQAYLKASNTDADDLFGSSVTLSADGALLAVGAIREDGNGQGVDPPAQSDNSAEDSGAAYLFGRDTGGWAQVAYFKASNTRRTERFATALALSADGTVLVAGAPTEDSLGIGIDGDQSQTFGGDMGAVYAFRDEGAGWLQSTYVKATNTDQNPSFPGLGRDLRFGTALALSDDAAVLAVGAPLDGSDATGVGGDDVNDNAWQSGAVFMY